MAQLSQAWREGCHLFFFSLCFSAVSMSGSFSLSLSRSFIHFLQNTLLSPVGMFGPTAYSEKRLIARQNKHLHFVATVVKRG